MKKMNKYKNINERQSKRRYILIYILDHLTFLIEIISILRCKRFCEINLSLLDSYWNHLEPHNK